MVLLDLKYGFVNNNLYNYMLTQPKKTKYKKIRKGVLKKLEYKMNSLNFGTVGLKAIESGIILLNQLEAARQAINRKLNRKGKIWIRIYPNYPITRKPVEVRMGKGKGQVSYWGAKISGGTILFEICGISKDKAIYAFNSGSSKLPIKTKIIF
jgi:large subunit ribosomal protein L16